MAKSNKEDYWELKIVKKRPQLLPHAGGKGTYFTVYQEKGQWHWSLSLNSSPQGYAARSGRGYASKGGAKGAILTAYKAFAQKA